MKLPLYQIDAFADRVFAGNPAGVCPLPRWLDAPTMQGIAAENNLSETAFFVREGAGYAIRWFTPACEVDLCGHATLASGFAVLTMLEPGRASVTFSSASGPLTVTREGDLLALDFPARAPRRALLVPGLAEAMGAKPIECWQARDTMLLYGTEEEVRALKPDMSRLGAIDLFGVIATAPGRDADFVSRFFAPHVGVPEDPVTGSAHTTLVPYWAGRLGKKKLHARQVSARGGELWCEHLGERVKIAGRAVKYFEGTIEV